MADNTTTGRVQTMEVAQPKSDEASSAKKEVPESGKNPLEQAKNEAMGVLDEKWEGIKKGFATLKEATGLGVSPEIASAARERIVQGATDTAKGVLTLVGPPAEMVQAAYMSGNPTAIAQVQTMQQAQTQAAGAIVDHVKESVAQAYARNGLAGASAMVISSLGIEAVGGKGLGALSGAVAKVSDIVRLSKTPAEAASLLRKEAEAAKKAGKLDEAALFEKQAIEREKQAAKEAGGKDGVVAKSKKAQVKCFGKDSEVAKKKPHDYETQLKAQEKALNNMTVADYLKNRDLFDKVGRTGAAEQAKARATAAASMKNDLIRSGSSYADATKQVAAMDILHTPDLGAGGSGVMSGLGDSSVNRSIGASWGANDKARVLQMDAVAKDVPKAQQATTLMNVELKRC